MSSPIVMMSNNKGAEIMLESGEPCCLSEVFLPNVESYEEFKDILQLLYRINRHSLMLPAHREVTQEVVRRNFRMGIGITGYLQASEEQREWLAPGYDYLRDVDLAFSLSRGEPTSIKLTTIKPSGTLSLLPGVTPGCHPAFARHMIRRIRLASNSPLAEVCREHGYPVEPARRFDGSSDPTTVVVSFPFSYPEGTTLAKDMSAIDQLEVVRRLQRDWSDNAVSCTIYYKPEELTGVVEYLKKFYSYNFKSLSFLLHSGHGFDQAPLEEITEEEHAELVSRVTPITAISFVEEFEVEDDCAGGACPVR